MTPEEALDKLEKLVKKYPHEKTLGEIAILILKMDLVIESATLRLRQYMDCTEPEICDNIVKKVLAITSNMNPESNIPKGEDCS
jgi:hypothetical protein